MAAGVSVEATSPISRFCSRTALGIGTGAAAKSGTGPAVRKTLVADLGLIDLGLL
jgi:hypothetical protein